MARLLRAWVRPLVAVAVLAGGAAGLCGCSDESEPSVSVTPTVTDGGVLSPSPSPSPTALPELTGQEVRDALPPVALVESYPGALEFVKFFLPLSQEILTTRDSRLFLALSGDECTFCVASIAVLDDVVARDLSVEGGEITFPGTTDAGGLLDDGTWNVSLDVDIAPQTLTDSSGTVTTVKDPERLRVGVSLEFVGGMWTVLDVGAEARP